MQKKETDTNMSHSIRIVGNIGKDAVMAKTTSAQARTLVKFSLADNPQGYRNRTTGAWETGGEVTWRQCVVSGALATETLRAQLRQGRKVVVEGRLGPIVAKIMKDSEGNDIARAFQDVFVTSVMFAPDLPPRADSAPPSTEDEHASSDDESDDLPL